LRHLKHIRTNRLGIVAVYVPAVLSGAIRMDRAGSIESGERDARNAAVVGGAQVEPAMHSLNVVLRRSPTRIDMVHPVAPDERGSPSGSAFRFASPSFADIGDSGPL
jgi:hypothetical protein